MSILVSFLILFVLFLIADFFAAAETALFSLSRVERKRVEQKHPWFSVWVKDHLNHPRRTLITILIGNLVVHILATSLVTLMALRYWGPGGVGFAVAIFTLLLIIFGEIIPKAFAVRYNDTLSMILSIPLKLFSILIFPIRWFIFIIADWMLKFIVARKEVTDHISEDELKAMVKIGEEDGILDRQERRMIQKLFELGERPVKDIMTPRIDVKALDVEDRHQEQMAMLHKHHFSHFPVFHESIDNILGVISAQEYMLHRDRDLRDLMKQPLFVPETKLIDDLLTEFKGKKQNYAVCVDEYGGTAGIVTLEDILEEIFGEFYDEYAKVENPIRPFGHHEYLVEAKVSIADFNEYFSTRLEADEASTLGGFILEKLGEVPPKGKVISTSDCEIRVQEVIRKRRIQRVVVKLKK